MDDDFPMTTSCTERSAFLFATVLLFASLTETVSAKIGETKEEINKRYGPPNKVLPASPIGDLQFHRHNDFDIAVCFINGKSVMESLAPKGDRLMDEKECEMLGRLIGGNNIWNLQSKQEVGTMLIALWSTKDKRLSMVRAGTSQNTKSLMVWAKEFDDFSLGASLKKEGPIRL